MVKKRDGCVPPRQLRFEEVELVLAEHARRGPVVGIEADETVASAVVAEGDGEVLRARNESGAERVVEAVAHAARTGLTRVVEVAVLPPVVVPAGDEVVARAARLHVRGS